MTHLRVSSFAFVPTFRLSGTFFNNMAPPSFLPFGGEGLLPDFQSFIDASLPADFFFPDR